MADITASPFLTLSSSVGFGDTDTYGAHISQFEFQPNQPTSSVTAIDGTTTNFGGKSNYVLALGLFQDWETANSLSSFLVTNDGEDIDVTIAVPGGTWAATVVGAAPHIGGSANSPAVSQLTLQVKGKPVFTAA